MFTRTIEDDKRDCYRRGYHQSADCFGHQTPTHILDKPKKDVEIVEPTQAFITHASNLLLGSEARNVLLEFHSYQFPTHKSREQGSYNRTGNTAHFR